MYIQTTIVRPTIGQASACSRSTRIRRVPLHPRNKRVESIQSAIVPPPALSPQLTASLGMNILVGVSIIVLVINMYNSIKDRDDNHIWRSS